MKPVLTKEQLKQIEDKLYNDYDFHYDDSKYEIIDHIASEIEEKMQFDSFESVCENVFNQWRDRLKETEWNGKYLYGKIKIPAFYKSKVDKTFKVDFMIWLVATISFPLFLIICKNSFSINVINEIFNGYKIIVCTLVILLNLYLIKELKENSINTVYKEIATYNVSKNLKPVLFLSLYFMLFYTKINPEKIQLAIVFSLFFNAFLFMFLLKYCNYFRHLKIVNRIKTMKFNF